MTDPNARDHTTTPAGARGHDHTEAVPATENTETAGTEAGKDYVPELSDLDHTEAGPPVTGPVTALFFISVLFVGVAVAVHVEAGTVARPGLLYFLSYFFAGTGAVTGALFGAAVWDDHR